MTVQNASTATNVLVYGSDELLLETRAMILQKAGYSVFSTLRAEEVKKFLQDEEIALLLLCHSLSTAKCEEALQYAETRNPETRSLVLTAGTSPCSERANDTVLSVLDGPRKLVETVETMLQGGPGTSGR